MSSPAEGAASLLTSAGIATSGWEIKVGRLVDKPDKLIVMMDTPGQNPNPKWLLSYPFIQAIVRGPKDGYGAGWAKAKEVQDVLLGLEPQDVNGDRWSGVTGVGDISFVRYDDNNRPLFSVNFRLLLEPATSPLTNREPL